MLLSGHGESVAGRYFYYPSDARLDGDHNVETDGIAIETWARWIASVQVGKKLIVVDTCKSWDAIAAVKSSNVEHIVQESWQTAFRTPLATACSLRPARRLWRATPLVMAC